MGTQPQKALAIFAALLRQSLVPEAITYSALVSTCEKGLEAGRALEIFEELLRQGLLPDAITIKSLMLAC